MDMSQLDHHILFEDDDILVLNKPAGWVVNRSHTQSEPTIQDWMEGRLSGILKSLKAELKDDVKVAKTDNDEDYGSPEQIFVERGGVAHRLDKDTSGVLILAKNPSSLAALMRQFKERNTSKTYLALVHGKVVPVEGIINLPTERSSSEREKFAVSATGKASETQYKVLEHFPGLPKGMHQKKGKSYQGFTLLELVPKTGRTHQIRVHMSAIKHPLVGDSTYAGRKRIELDREWSQRHFLHAKKLCITHPTTQENMCFESPLPQDLSESLSKLQES
jgi:23S rRNA pseudouridine1911/1915/1917 synthase